MLFFDYYNYRKVLEKASKLTPSNNKIRAVLCFVLLQRKLVREFQHKEGKAGAYPKRRDYSFPSNPLQKKVNIAMDESSDVFCFPVHIKKMFT